MPNQVGQLRGRFTDKDGNLTPEMSRAMNDWMSRVVRAVDQQNRVIGDLYAQFISAQTKITGRTEGIGTTASKLNATGNLLSTDNIAADGTGSPLTGGKRGFIGLDSNSRLASSFFANQVNVSGVPTSSSVLSNNGVDSAIIVSAFTVQYGFGTVAYNGGTVDPGVIPGTFAVFFDDPTFAGGTVTYQFSTTVPDQAANDGRVLVGIITTAVGTPHTGGGYTGGDTPGGGGGRGYNKF